MIKAKIVDRPSYHLTTLDPPPPTKTNFILLYLYEWREFLNMRYKIIPNEQCALQRKNTEFLKQIFPEKEYRGLGPNFHIHVSVSDFIYFHNRSASFARGNM